MLPSSTSPVMMMKIGFKAVSAATFVGAGAWYVEECKARRQAFTTQVERARHAVVTSGAAHVLENDVARRFLVFAADGTTTKPLSECVATIHPKDWNPEVYGNRTVGEESFPALPSALPWWVWEGKVCELEAFRELQDSLGLPGLYPGTRALYNALPTLMKDPLVKEYMADCEEWHKHRCKKLSRKYKVETHVDTPTVPPATSSEILWLNPLVVWKDNLSI